MTPEHVMSGAIEQLLLFVFVLITLVSFAGGNPASVLAPICELLTRLIVSLVGLAFAAITAIVKALITLTPTLLRSVAGESQSASSRRIR